MENVDWLIEEAPCLPQESIKWRFNGINNDITCGMYIFKPSLGGGLQRVNIPKQDDKGNVMKDGNGNEIWEVLLDANDIHKAILEQNKKHFHQAMDTPFGGSPNDSMLFDLVSYSGMNAAAKEIVKGTFLTTYGNNLELLPETEQLIKQLAMPEEIKVLGEKISYEVTEADFISGFKGWKECTSTSPLGHHLGHYKAMINDPDQKKAELCDHMMDFVELMVNMINILLKYSFVPKQWCQSITVMIKKDPGNPWIECLWVIHLFEADYNFCLKFLWGHHLVYQGEDNKCFGYQQYGSWPWHQAIDAIYKKTLTYDLLHIMWLALLMFDNDASGCFDRIIVALATIAALQLAFPRTAAQMHAKVLIGMKYFVKMAHGISEAFYKVHHPSYCLGHDKGVVHHLPSGWQ